MYSKAKETDKIQIDTFTLYPKVSYILSFIYTIAAKQNKVDHAENEQAPHQKHLSTLTFVITSNKYCPFDEELYIPAWGIGNM